MYTNTSIHDMMMNTWKLFLDDIRDPIGSDCLITLAMNCLTFQQSVL